MKSLKFPLFLTILTFILTACSFNKMFLQPTKLPSVPLDKDKISITSKSENDTTIVEFNTKTLQPTFFTNKSTHFAPSGASKSLEYSGIDSDTLLAIFANI